MDIDIPSRDQIPEKDKWDLSPLFANDEEWESSFKNLELIINQISAYKGRLQESVRVFKEAILLELDINRKLEMLFTYAQLRSDEDKSNQKYQGLYQRSLSLYARISGLLSFISPEIQSIPEEIISRYIQDPVIEDYRFHINKILRYKPHTLNQETEEVLALSGEISQAPSEFFSMLDNADLKFGTVENEKGEKIELSHGNFNSFLISPQREVRKNAFFRYYEAYHNHSQSISTALAYSVKKDLFYSKVRKFPDCRHTAIFADDVPDNVYDNLLITVKNNLGPLFNYFRFRKEALGLADLHFYDTYVPVIKEIKFKMPYEEAVSVSVHALHPLGSDYTSRLKEGLLGSWVDKYENRGKRSGAYSSGCYDSPPYILINYKDDNINSLYTLIHEAGHSMHSLYSRENQPYHYHEYAIFTAEVASTFNEILLSNYLLEYYKNDLNMQAYILNRETDNIRATLFRQTMFAEFEKIIHQIIERNAPLTLEVMTEEYRMLLNIYFGSTMVIDDVLKLECLRIPHFYRAFYVYKYATGISAAIALAGKVLKGDPSAVESYINFLKMGGSRFPLEELASAGVDMSRPEPVEKAINYFNNTVDRLINVFNELE